MESATIIDEAVQQFTAKLVVNAKMSVEIKPTILFLKYSEYSGRA
jgi:hypothetical protein